MGLPDGGGSVEELTKQVMQFGVSETLEEDMVSLVRDLRSARHARSAAATPSATPGAGAPPAFPYGALALAQTLPGAGSQQPTSAAQADAARTWMQTSGVTATPTGKGPSGGAAAASVSASPQPNPNTGRPDSARPTEV